MPAALSVFIHAEDGIRDHNRSQISNREQRLLCSCRTPLARETVEPRNACPNTTPFAMSQPQWGASYRFRADFIVCPPVVGGRSDALNVDFNGSAARSMIVGIVVSDVERSDDRVYVALVAVYRRVFQILDRVLEPGRARLER